MEKQSKRIEWLDGLKGILCVLIFAHHFFLIFLPAIHYGSVAPSYLGGVDTFLSQFPLSVVLNGNYMVALFCTISAVVISRSLMISQDKDRLLSVVVKRYFRLMLPLFVVGFVTFLFSQFGFFTNQRVGEMTGSPWAVQYYKEPISLWRFLSSAFINTWFFGDSTLATSFWMLSDLFIGTFVCVLLCLVSWKFPKKAWIVYLVIGACFVDKSELTTAFILGTLIAWISVHAPQVFNRYAGIAALIVGVLLGGYPSGVMPTNFYRLMSFLSYVDWHILGAAFTLYGVFSCKIFQTLLSGKVFKWLGTISFAVYLLHIFVLFSLTTGLFLLLYPVCGYFPSVTICFVVSLTVLLAAAFFYQKYVESACGKLQNKLLGMLEK